MTPSELTGLIAALPPGRRVTVLIIDGASDQESSITVLGRPAVPAESPGSPAAEKERSAQNSPLHVAQSVASSTPDVRWTPAEWAARLGGAISVRELQRAIEYGALPARERGKGRGHGARVISPGHMVEFLILRENGRHARDGRPSWYGDVVKEVRRAA